MTFFQKSQKKCFFLKKWISGLGWPDELNNFIRSCLGPTNWPGKVPGKFSGGFKKVLKKFCRTKKKFKIWPENVCTSKTCRQHVTKPLHYRRAAPHTFRISSPINIVMILMRILNLLRSSVSHLRVPMVTIAKGGGPKALSSFWRQRP